MRRVVLQEFVSLDGLAAGENDSVAFIPASTQGDQSFGREQLALMDAIDAILFGAVTYRMFAGFWPNVTEGEEKPFADKVNATPKVVFSKTLERASWGSWDEARIVKGSAVDEVTRLKGEPGRDMLIWGSISLAQSLMAAKLIDEYRLVLCPVVLGSGKPLFGDELASIPMHLVNVQRLDRGVVSLTYVPRQV
jgi:dihydrofolate reductase